MNLLLFIWYLNSLNCERTSILCSDKRFIHTSSHSWSSTVSFAQRFHSFSSYEYHLSDVFTLYSRYSMKRKTTMKRKTLLVKLKIENKRILIRINKLQWKYAIIITAQKCPKAWVFKIIIYKNGKRIDKKLFEYSYLIAFNWIVSWVWLLNRVMLFDCKKIQKFRINYIWLSSKWKIYLKPKWTFAKM